MDRATADPLAELLAARPISAARWGLEGIEALLAALGHPERSFESIHIAGTNGKGSTAAVIAALLSEHGFRVGLYTSPHLQDVRERFLIDGAPADEALLQRLAARIGALPEAGPASYFEVTTALAFALFAARDVEWAVVETGLGGRLDSTNVLRPRVTCVTSIGLDHATFLGDTLEAIAHEKAGIFKRGVPAVLGERNPSIRGVLAGVAGALGAPVETLGERSGIEVEDITLGGTAFRYRSPAFPDGLRLHTPLVGEHQARNAGLALLSLEAAGVRLRAGAVEAAVTRTRVPGRFEVRREGDALWILDIAHNREAMAALLECLSRVDPPRPWVSLVSVLDDKPWADMVEMLRQAADAIILVSPASTPPDRRWDVELVRERFAAFPQVSAEADLERALGSARERSDDGTVLVTGSAHTVGDVRGILEAGEEA